MKIDTEELLKKYATDGWAISDIVSSGENIASFPQELSTQPVIIPVRRSMDLSSFQSRRLLGLTPDDHVITFHSGVFGGEGPMSEIAGEVTKQFRESGVVVCNGGVPSKPGLMRNIVEGALSAQGKDLPPIIIVVTESLFRTDNLRGNYPLGNLRILILEDSQHLPDTVVRAHTLNTIPNGIITLKGGLGTFTEAFHIFENMGLTPDKYPTSMLMVNFEDYFRGILLQLNDGFRDKMIAPLPNVGVYTPESSQAGLPSIRDIARDITKTFQRVFEGVSLQEQMTNSRVKAGLLEPLEVSAARIGSTLAGPSL